MGEQGMRRRLLRHQLYKLIVVLLVLNAFKWIPHPFGLNAAQLFNQGPEIYVALERFEP